MNFKETAYWTLYADIVNFHRKYAEVREDDEYWARVVDASNELYEKNGFIKICLKSMNKHKLFI